MFKTTSAVEQQLRAMRQQIPDFVLMPRAELRSLAKAASVNAAFVQGTINAVGASEPLRSAIGPTAEELRQETDLAGRWSSVIDELDAFRAGVHTAVTIRRHRVGLLALQAYRVAQQLVRNKDHANLLPYVEAMQRRAKFGP